MKRVLSSLIVFCMVLSSIIVFANEDLDINNVESNNIDYQVIQNSSGEYIATNITSRDLEVYVTDGYNPIKNADVTINESSVVTDSDGVAYFYNLPTSENAYSLYVSSEDFGEKTNDVLLLSSQKLESANQNISANQFTVSFWQPQAVQIMTMSDDDYGIDLQSVSGGNTWQYNTNAPTNVTNVFEYDGLIYVLGDTFEAYDPTSGTWAVLTSTSVSAEVNAIYNGVLYAYSTSDVTDYDDPSVEDKRYWFVAYDLQDMSSTVARSSSWGGVTYNNMILASHYMIMAGGEYYRNGSIPLVDYNAFDCFDLNADRLDGSYEISLGGSEATMATSAETGDYYNHVFIFDNGKRITDVQTSTIETSNPSSSGSRTVYYENQTANVHNGKIYFVGGSISSDAVRIYDINSDSWSTGTESPASFSGEHATVLSGDRLYSMKNGALDIYDTSDNSWILGASPSIDITNNNAVLYNGKIYAVDSLDGTMGVYTIPDDNSFVSSSPIEVDYENSFTQIDAYREQTLAIDNSGNVVVWGEGYYGDGSGSMKITALPTVISGIQNAVQVSRGKNHNLVLTSNGDVYGWGSNTNYPMGTAASGKVKTATKIPNISDVSQIAAGTEFSIFLKTDGTLWGVGKNDKGQLGQSGITETSTPLQITTKADFTKVSVGDDYVVAIASDGIYTWGGNKYGQLGIGTRSDTINGLPTLLSITLADNESFSDISAGTRFCMGLTNLGNVYVWGDNANGEYGLNNKTSYSIPKKNTYISGITKIAAGVNNAIAVKTDGTVYGWGYNKSGNTGFTSNGSILTPHVIAALSGHSITAVTCGNDFSTALSSSGTVYTFGCNKKGSLGVENIN